MARIIGGLNSLHLRSGTRYKTRPKKYVNESPVVFEKEDVKETPILEETPIMADFPTSETRRKKKNGGAKNVQFTPLRSEGIEQEEEVKPPGKAKTQKQRTPRKDKDILIIEDEIDQQLQDAKTPSKSKGPKAKTPPKDKDVQIIKDEIGQQLEGEKTPSKSKGQKAKTPRKDKEVPTIDQSQVHSPGKGEEEKIEPEKSSKMAVKSSSEPSRLEVKQNRKKPQKKSKK